MKEMPPTHAARRLNDDLAPRREVKRMSKIVVLEVGRPIAKDVEAQVGAIDAKISYPRAISEVEIPKIAAEAYKAISEAAQGGEEVTVVLSGPLALAFELGQLVGLGKFKVKVMQFSQGRYVEVPPVTREHMFS